MKSLIDRYRPLLAADDPGAGGGGGSPPPPPAGADPGGGAADPSGGQPGGGGASAPYRPDGLPDHLIGANERETADKLTAEWLRQRQAASTRGAVPDKPEGYEFQWAEPLQPYMQGLQSEGFDKEFLGRVRNSAHKWGMGTTQLNGFVNEVLAEMVAGDLVEAPLDTKAERAALVPEDAQTLPEAEQRAAVDKRVNDNLAFIQSLTQGDAKSAMPKEVADFLTAQLGDRANGHRAIEWIRGRLSGEGGAQPYNGQGGNQTNERERLKALKADPRYGEDRAYTEDVARQYQAAERAGLL